MSDSTMVISGKSTAVSKKVIAYPFPTGSELPGIESKEIIECLNVLKSKKLDMVRALAAKQLGKLKNSSAVLPLIKLLKLERSKVVLIAMIWALGELGDTRALSPLRDMRRRGRDVWDAAYSAIGKIESKYIWEYKNNAPE